MPNIVLTSYGNVTSTADPNPGDVVRNEHGIELRIVGLMRVTINPSECPSFESGAWDRELDQWKDLD